MLLLRRAFSQLSVQLSKGISPLILACSKSDFTQTEDFVVYPEAISELIKYQRTNDAIHKLIQNHISHTGSPVLLGEESYSDVIKYLNYSLISRDMQALDSAIHLLWHSFPEKKFPLVSIVSTLVVTKPLGSEENQKIWRKLASQMAFYALPNKISPEIVREFLTNYGKFPENFLPIIKQAIMTNDEPGFYKYLEKMMGVCLGVEKYLDFEFEMEIKGIDRKSNVIDRYIKSKFMTTEEESEFRAISSSIKEQLADNKWFNTRYEGVLNYENAEREMLKHVKKETINQLYEFYEEYEKKRTINSNDASQLDLFDNLTSKPNEEWFEYLKSEYYIDQEYRFTDYQMNDKIQECLNYCRPGLEDFEHLEKWLQELVSKDLKLYIPEYCFPSLIYHALRHNKDEFICFLYNNYDKLAICEMPAVLLVEIIRIIANNDTLGNHVEAAGAIIKMTESPVFLQQNEIGLFTYDTVADNFLLCYLKDKRFDDAKTFAFEMGLCGYEFDENYIEQIIEYLNTKKDYNGMMMIRTLNLSLVLKSKLYNYMKILRDDAEKEGIYLDVFFSISKFYINPTKYMYNYLKYDLAGNQKRIARLDQRQKEKLEKLEAEEAEKGGPAKEEAVEEEALQEIEEIVKDS